MTTLIFFASTLSKQKTEFKISRSSLTRHLFFLLQSGILILLKSFRIENQIKKVNVCKVDLWFQRENYSSYPTSFQPIEVSTSFFL